MITAKLTSPIVGSGASLVYPRQPKVWDDYTLASLRQDGPEVPGEPVTLIVTCTEDVWEALSADPEYKDRIKWSRVVPKQVKRFLRQ